MSRPQADKQFLWLVLDIGRRHGKEVAGHSCQTITHLKVAICNWNNMHDVLNSQTISLQSQCVIHVLRSAEVHKCSPTAHCGLHTPQPTQFQCTECTVMTLLHSRIAWNHNIKPYYSNSSPIKDISGFHQVFHIISKKDKNEGSCFRVVFWCVLEYVSGVCFAEVKPALLKVDHAKKKVLRMWWQRGESRFTSASGFRS